MAATPNGQLSGIRQYHQHTRGAFTGFLMGLPLTFAYAAAATFGPLDPQERDFFLRLQIDFLGEPIYKVLQLSIAGAFLLAVIILQRRGRFRAGYFGPLVVESMLYAAVAAAVVWFASSNLHLNPPFAPPKAGLEPFVSALGEAVNQETLFRWVLLECLVALMWKIGRFPRWLAQVLAIVVGAAAYAAVGTFATPLPSNDLVDLAGRAFTLGVSGLFFGTLYIARGYPACAYTHVFHATFWTGVAPYIGLRGY